MPGDGSSFSAYGPLATKWVDTSHAGPRARQARNFHASSNHVPFRSTPVKEYPGNRLPIWAATARRRRPNLPTWTDRSVAPLPIIEWIGLEEPAVRAPPTTDKVSANRRRRAAWRWPRARPANRRNCRIRTDLRNVRKSGGVSFRGTPIGRPTFDLMRTIVRLPAAGGSISSAGRPWVARAVGADRTGADRTGGGGAWYPENRDERIGTPAHLTSDA